MSVNGSGISKKSPGSELVVLFHLVPEEVDTGRWTNTIPGSIDGALANLKGSRPESTIFYYTPDNGIEPRIGKSMNGQEIDYRKLLSGATSLFLEAKKTVYHKIIHPVAHWRNATAKPEEANKGIEAELRFSLLAAKQLLDDRKANQIIVVQDFPLILTAWLSSARILNPEINAEFKTLFEKYNLSDEFGDLCKRIAGSKIPEPVISWFHHTCTPTPQSWSSIGEIDPEYQKVFGRILSETSLVVQSNRDLETLEATVGPPKAGVFRNAHPFGFNLDRRLELAKAKEQNKYWLEIENEFNIKPTDTVIGIVTRADDPKNRLHTAFISVLEHLREHPEKAKSPVFLLQTQLTRSGASYEGLNSSLVVQNGAKQVSEYQDQNDLNDAAYIELLREFPDLRVGWYTDGVGSRGNVVSAVSDVFLATGSPGGLEVTPVETLHLANQRSIGGLCSESMDSYDRMRGNRDRPVSLVVTRGAGIAEHIEAVGLNGGFVYRDDFTIQLKEALDNMPTSFTVDQLPGFKNLLDRLDGPNWFTACLEAPFGVSDAIKALHTSDARPVIAIGGLPH